jgi:uncharacterized membrane protein (UPF0127 family)
MRVVNATQETVISSACAEARSFFARLQGLMGHPGLNPGEGLLIKPCSSVHSFFMRFPIDVIFVDKQDVVVGLTPAMAPNLPYAGARRAHYVIELPVGTIAASATTIGDQLRIERD